MILENLTREIFGYSPSSLKLGSSKEVFSTCDICGKLKITTIYKYKDLCHLCAMKICKRTGKNGYGFPIEIERELLLGMYLGEEYTVDKMTEILHCSRTAIIRLLKKNSIDIRGLSESHIGKPSSRIGIKMSDEQKSKLSKSLKGRLAWNKGITMSIETKIKLSNSLMGRNPNSGSFRKNHIPWNAGTSVKTPLQKLIRESKMYNRWRTSIFERDNWICQGCDIHNDNLMVHHWISFAEILRCNQIKSLDDAYDCNELWSISNGVTCCCECHKILHRIRGKIKIESSTNSEYKDFILKRKNNKL